MTLKINFFILSFISFLAVSQTTDVIMNAGSNNTTVNTCLGGLYDSGGSGAGGPYQNNESYTITVCPDVPGDFITLSWTVFNLDPTNTSVVPNTTNADNITIYDGDDATAPTLGTYYSGDLTPGDLFGATSTNTTGCLTIVFNSNGTGTGDFNAQLSCATPCDPPTAAGIIVNADNPQGDSIAVCVNEQITFQDNGSIPGSSGLFVLERWVWSWGDGSDNDTLLSGAAVTHNYSQPGQYTVQLIVIDDNDCVNTNATDIRVFVSTYPTFIPFPGDTTLCIGESIELAAQPTNYDQTWTGFPVTVQDPTNCMEDLTGISQPTPLPITGFDSNHILDASNGDITSICVDIEHSFIGDFVLQIQCPTGQTMTLHQQGGGGVNLGDVTTTAQGIIDCNDPATFGVPWTYCFDENATDTWVDAIAAGGNTVPNSGGGNSLVPGTYAPIDPFSNLDGCPINGTWNLLFTDLWGADDGSLPGFTINFAPPLYPPVTVFTPNIGGGSDSSYWDLTDQFITSNSPDYDTIIVTPLNAGSFDYTYYAINDFGCSFDSTITIQVDPLEQISAGPDVVLCGNLPVQIGPDATTGGSCDYNILLTDSWGDGWGSHNVDFITSAGTTSSTGPATDSLWITLPVINGEIVTIDFNSVGFGAGECEIQIFDGDGNLVYQDGAGFLAPSNAPQIIVANCFVGYTFDWTPAGTILSSPNDQNPTVQPGVATTYTLTSYPTGHPLCATTDDVDVILGPDIDPGVDSTGNLCFGGPPVDLIDYLGGTPQPGGLWIDATGGTYTMPVDPSTFAPGVYEYRIDSMNCSLSAFLTVNIIQLPITLALTDATCHSIADGTIDVSSPSAAAYSINGGANWQVPNLFSALPAGVYNVVLSSGPNGTECLVDTTVTIVEPDPLQITSMVQDQTVCPGDNINLTAIGLGGSSNYTYTWDNGIGTGQLVNHEPTASSTICLTLSEACGSPPAVECVEITVPADIEFNYYFGDDPTAKTTAGCFPHSFSIENISTSTTIFDGNGTILSPATDVELSTTTWNIIGDKTLASKGLDSLTHTIQNAGVYDVEVITTSYEGCEYVTYLPSIINVLDRPNADFAFTPNTLTMFSTEADFIDLTTGDPVQWLWNFQGAPSPDVSTIQNPFVKYQEGKPGTYEIDLKVWDANNCTDSVKRTLIIENDVNVFAPNIFTPDGDGYNDDWRVFITGIEIYDFHLTIYNRWGELVFESFDPEASWDGTYGNGGSTVLSGTYVWAIETKDIEKDNRYEFNGSIIIQN